ncbi:uncharacterized protein LOC129580352 [Sitodiplosis mosellana]|uniref:uncharacterized protein LOC129580352 n=1 Tax=Sitodiplosis mosellana TaxID=263140 RepID=UPI002443EBC4|nr:uncharacterized protein LOC129580352 [Sitodiplosis mosellana]
MYFRVLIVVSLLKLSECYNGNFFGTAELIKNVQPRRSRLLSDFVDNAPADNSRSGFVPISIPLSAARSLLVSSEKPTTIDEPKSTEQPEELKSEPIEDEEGPVPTADTMRKYARIFKMDTETLNEKQKLLLQRIVQRIARLNGASPDEESIDLNDNEGRARRKNRDEHKKTQKKTSTTTIEVVTEPTKTTPKLKTTPSIQSSSSSAQKKKVAASNNYIAISKPTMPTIASKMGKSKVTQANDLTLTNATSVDLGNISTTSIVDILSTDNARENFYIRRPSPSTITTLHNKIQPQKPQSIKPTKYHFYPHNQHIYVLPECAIQQVCNAVYVRLNYTQPLCACPSRYRDPCSASIDEDDLHTTKLIGDPQKRAITLAKTCEATTEMRECRTPRDWSLLALQNIRTGKSHYLVICKCPDAYNLEGPMAHDQPTYASVPGIRVFGMMCVKPTGEVNTSLHIQRPVPPKRNQYFQSQTSYYNRFKKHTLSKLSAQQKTNENGANLSTQSFDSADFTTRGISIIPSNSETREDVSNESSQEAATEEEEEVPSSTFDASSSSYSTTFSSTDSVPTEPATETSSRKKRDTGDGSNVTDESAMFESNSRSKRDDWPDIPWDEISQQIKDIQWD